MKPLQVVAILLLMGGTIALAYQSIHYTTQEKVINLGALQVTTDKDHTLPMPPLVGIATIIGGITLLIISFKKG